MIAVCVSFLDIIFIQFGACQRGVCIGSNCCSARVKVTLEPIGSQMSAGRRFTGDRVSQPQEKLDLTAARPWPIPVILIELATQPLLSPAAETLANRQDQGEARR